MTLIVKEDVMEILNSYDIPQVVRTYVKCLPPVQPSRRKGHWIVDGVHWKPIFKCSECGSVIKEMPTVMDKPKYKGCPYCLAEMRGDTE